MRQARAKNTATKKNLWLKHLGIYAYPKDILSQLVRRPQPPLEVAEQLEQLRALYYGWPIYVATARGDSIGVDTPADLKKVERIFKLRRR